MPPQFNFPSGICVPRLSEKQVKEIIKDRNDATTVFDATKTYAALDNEVYFISQRVLDIISQIQKSHPTVAIDMSNTTIFNSDAKVIDFTKIDVSYAFIDQV
jgi:hypothetical protein